ncbi:ExbD/TolR family protein [Primorskyibacter marinus]|uniref:ExbD/TolR family protein n=1 Tax=Primorskyibacter marinus TaxID=1977320 RepID=UPI000E300328|nr:biopolymer transporter ExbD [Primorskyibacter marinus]
MLSLAAPPRRRRPSLTPMIDVVFLLLVFFMLAARFGGENVVPLVIGGAGDGWTGPPRLVEVKATGLTLNGIPVARDALADALAPLMPTPDAPVILRGGEGASVQDMLSLLDLLRAAGLTSLVVAE